MLAFGKIIVKHSFASMGYSKWPNGYLIIKCPEFDHVTAGGEETVGTSNLGHK